MNIGEDFGQISLLSLIETVIKGLDMRLGVVHDIQCRIENNLAAFHPPEKIAFKLVQRGTAFCDQSVILVQCIL